MLQFLDVSIFETSETSKRRFKQWNCRGRFIFETVIDVSNLVKNLSLEPVFGPESHGAICFGSFCRFQIEKSSCCLLWQLGAVTPDDPKHGIYMHVTFYYDRIFTIGFRYTVRNKQYFNLLQFHQLRLSCASVRCSPQKSAHLWGPSPVKP